MNTMEPTQAETGCERCGQRFFYEPILIFGRDLARGLHRYCEACSEADAAEERRLAAECRQAELRETVRRTLPPELLPKHLDPLGTDTGHPEFYGKMWRLVRQWRPGPHGNWIGLVGPAGQCKTRCLALLAEIIMMQGNRLVWTSAMRLHTEATMNLRSRERQIQQLARDHLADCQNSPWLVIDDLGNNEWSPAFESQLFTILDHRKNYRLPIAYSSNAHPSAFYPCITSVNPDALIGRLLDRTNLFDFTPETQLEMVP